MTSFLQPCDISVNKVFKDKIRFFFEQNRLIYDNENPKTKLNTARIDILNFINNIWPNEDYITKNTIINGFKKAGFIGNNYLTDEEENIYKNCI